MSNTTAPTQAPRTGRDFQPGDRVIDIYGRRWTVSDTRPSQIFVSEQHDKWFHPTKVRLASK